MKLWEGIQKPDALHPMTELKNERASEDARRRVAAEQN
jgi:hypothetical protein